MKQCISLFGTANTPIEEKINDTKIYINTLNTEREGVNEEIIKIQEE
jgi:hypothetical protein